MQKRLSKKARFFNNFNSTADDEVYVGIDVHKINYHIAIWLNDAIALVRPLELVLYVPIVGIVKGCIQIQS